MRDVLILCEGQTEREFCNTVIRGHLHAHGVSLSGTLVAKPRGKSGGIAKWPVYRRELTNRAKERSDRHVGLLVDYYAMPKSWPGRTEAKTLPHAGRGEHVEQALTAAMRDSCGERFIPCVQLHEFESLLFVDPRQTALSLAISAGMEETQRLETALAIIKMDCNNCVEGINDSVHTAPSKRIGGLVAGYDKVAWGVMAAADTPLAELRAGCPWLRRWLERLERLGD